MSEKKRKYGLDLLRIVSMMMILILHLLGKGGVLNDTKLFSFNNNLAWILENLCIVAVNCYILISGYFSVTSKKFNIKRIINIWGKVIFYSVTIGVTLMIIGWADKNIINMLNTFFPIITKSYWFISVYIVLSVLSPFLNLMIQRLTKEQYRKLIVVMMVVFSIIPSFVPSEFMIDITGGLGICWFITLYLVAGYIRLHIPEEKIFKKTFLKYLVFSMILFAFRSVLALVLERLNMDINHSQKWLSYNTIILFLSSLYLFLYFKQMDIKNNKIISFIEKITPYILSVYIIHEQPLLRKILYTDILDIGAFLNKWYLIFIVFSYAVIIFIICIFIDYIRHYVCERIARTKIGTRAEEFLNKTTAAIKKIASNMFDKCEN